MHARMSNPAIIVPDAMQALHTLKTATEEGGVPSTTIALVELRASQINGDSVCVDSHPRFMKKAGETDQRIFAVAAWRHALSDREDPVPDEIWEEAARHYDEPALAALIIAIANINVWNRFNVAVGQVAGQWKP